MTAREQLTAGLRLVGVQGDPPGVLVGNYTKELERAGHKITKPTGPKSNSVSYKAAHCTRCLTEFRVYHALNNATIIYSDFADGEQCAFRQFNMHGDRPWI